MVIKGDSSSLDYSIYRGYIGIVEKRLETTIMGLHRV